MALEQFRQGYSINGVQVNVEGDTTALNSFLDNFPTTYGLQKQLIATDHNGLQIMVLKSFAEQQWWNDYILVLVINEQMITYSKETQSSLIEGVPAIQQGWNELDPQTMASTPLSSNLDIALSHIDTVETCEYSLASAINGVYVGADLESTPLTQFGGALTVEGIDFGNVSEGDINADLGNLLLGYQGNDGSFVSFANGMALMGGSIEGKGLLYLWLGDDSEPIVFYATATIEGLVEAVGYQNLTDGKYTFSESTTVGAVGTDFSDWNGTLIGALAGGSPTPTPTDTVTAGTYSAATGIWTDNADYTVIDNGDGTYSATGLIPYGRADSLFAFAGYRFAVKISRDTITSRDDLPDGNIVVVTVGSETTQGTKANFETDGSLIYIAAPDSDTLSTLRVVKIAWSMAGDTLQESDFTSYTFDLSNAELAPIPVENEDESRVAYCITPKISSDKFVKVVAPSGGLRAGQVVNCVALASSVEGVGLNLEVYSPSLPTTATLGSKFYALIVNGGFENLADGRRPSGNPDYTKYVYNEGDVCQAILLDKNLVFEISGSCISGDTSIDPVADIGRYIVPTNGTYVMSIANAPTAGGCLKIIGTNYFRRGGLLTEGHISTYIALAIH